MSMFVTPVLYEPSRLERDLEQLHAERDCFFRPLPAPTSVWIVGTGPMALTFPTRKAAVNWVTRLALDKAASLNISVSSLIDITKQVAELVGEEVYLPPIRRIEIPARKPRTP